MNMQQLNLKIQSLADRDNASGVSGAWRSLTNASGVSDAVSFVRYEPGTILMYRMPGHSRSPVPGAEYFAPALVLEQFDVPTGDLRLIVWDSSAGNPTGVFHARELSTRGEGNEREQYVSQENVGEVLFSPHRLAETMKLIFELRDAVLSLQKDVLDLQTSPAHVVPAVPAVSPEPNLFTGAGAGAGVMSSSPTSQPKADAKGK